MSLAFKCDFCHGYFDGRPTTLQEETKEIGYVHVSDDPPLNLRVGIAFSGHEREACEPCHDRLLAEALRETLAKYEEAS